ncbi:beta/gamma crystallin-related protein [Streptomyces angustmyceticus]|uniref:beta/gamma crystallin-related protein n=1 Tax=Streptomyces angustmyceticus TaxID=285578 RepID=UPI00344E8434
MSSQEAAGTSKPRKAKVQLYEQPKCKGRYAVFTHSVADLRANGWEHSGSARNPGKRITCYERINYGGARFSLAPGESESAVVCRVTESAGPPRPTGRPLSHLRKPAPALAARSSRVPVSPA